METGLQNGMMARAIGYRIEDPKLVIVHLDVREFEKYNVNLMKPVYFDSKGVARFKWIETTDYPKDGIEDVYCNYTDHLPFELTEKNPIFSEYLESGSALPYMAWLENKIIR